MVQDRCINIYCIGTQKEKYPKFQAGGDYLQHQQEYCDPSRTTHSIGNKSETCPNSDTGGDSADCEQD